MLGLDGSSEAKEQPQGGSAPGMQPAHLTERLACCCSLIPFSMQAILGAGCRFVLKVGAQQGENSPAQPCILPLRPDTAGLALRRDQYSCGQHATNSYRKSGKRERPGMHPPSGRRKNTVPTK